MCFEEARFRAMLEARLELTPSGIRLITRAGRLRFLIHVHIVRLIGYELFAVSSC